MAYPTLTVVRELLETRSLAPQKRLGQNFLVYANVARKSLELAEVQPGDFIVEIGPGLGALSELLLDAGCDVYAIEKDAGLLRYLDEEVYPSYPGHFHLIHGDAMDLPTASLPDDTDSYKIVANLPYAISTPWLDGVLSGKQLPERMVLMLQKEAAMRFIADHGTSNFGPISIFLKSAYDLHRLHKVSAQCFYPRPDVGSALLSLKMKTDPLLFSSKTKDGIRQIFRQRRKQISSIIPKLKDAPEFETWLAKLVYEGMSPNTRPEAISIENWQRLIDR